MPPHSPQNAPSQIAAEWFEKVWNQKDESAIDRMLNPQGDVHGLFVRDATVLRGPEEFKKFHRAIVTAIPDLRLTITKTTEQGEWVAVRFVIEGTHTGKGISATPSNAAVSFSGMVLGRIRDGQWVEGWNTVDFLTLSQQIGSTLNIGLAG